MEQQSSSMIDTWAIVEIMGHLKLAGRVKTEPFGSCVMLRVDIPELPEKRDTISQSWDDEGRYFSTPREMEQIQPSEAAYTRYFGMASIFSLTPCDEQTAMAALDKMRRMPPKLLRIQGESQKALPSGLIDPPADDDLHDADGIAGEMNHIDEEVDV